MKKKNEEIKEEVKEEVKETKKETKKDIPEYYVMRIGESLKDVSEKFGVSEETLKELNENATFIGSNQIKIR